MKGLEALKYILGITIACVGWFIASTVTRINTKLDILLEDKAAKTEQIRALERATFGKVSEAEDQAYNCKFKRNFHDLLFDKTKTLQYLNKEFIYI
jgi:hypothetical protein